MPTRHLNHEKAGRLEKQNTWSLIRRDSNSTVLDITAHH